MKETYNLEEGEKYIYDEDEMKITKLGSLISMMHDNETITSISFMCKVAENKQLMALLMRLLEVDTRLEACHKLLYYNPRSLTSKVIKNNFVAAMKKQNDEVEKVERRKNGRRTR